MCIMPATVEIGTTLIVGDDDLNDRYIADLIKSDGCNLSVRNPIVQIRFILCYPIQHAVIWRNVPQENAPIFGGTICRLKVYGKASESQIRQFGNYSDSLRIAQEKALTDAISQGDKLTEEIIRRHIQGEYQRERVLVIYRKWEL